MEASQHERLITAMIDATGELGYSKVTVEDVARRARTAKRTFYTFFDDKEGCFVEAYDLTMGRILDSVAAALVEGDHPYRRIESGVTAFLEALAVSPNAARLGMIESLGAGPLASTHRVALLQTFADALVAWHEESRRDWPSAPVLSNVAAQAVIGAINEPVTIALLSGSVDSLDGLWRELSDIVMCLMFPGDPKRYDSDDQR